MPPDPPRGKGVATPLVVTAAYFTFNVWASETSMFGVAAESAKRMVGLSSGS